MKLRTLVLVATVLLDLWGAVVTVHAQDGRSRDDLLKEARENIEACRPSGHNDTQGTATAIPSVDCEKEANALVERALSLKFEPAELVRWIADARNDAWCQVLADRRAGKPCPGPGRIDRAGNCSKSDAQLDQECAEYIEEDLARESQRRNAHPDRYWVVEKCHGRKMSRGCCELYKPEVDTGRQISLDLRDTDLNNFMLILREVSQVPVLAEGESLNAKKLTLYAFDCPWQTMIRLGAKHLNVEAEISRVSITLRAKKTAE